MSQRRGSMSSVMSSGASSLHLPLDMMDDSVDRTHHRRQLHTKQPSLHDKPTPNEAYVKTLRPSPYATSVRARKGSASRAPQLPLTMQGKPAKASQGVASQSLHHHVRSLSASGRGGKSVVASHKSREDLLDEVAELRKESRTYQHERSLLTGRVRNLEEELVKKDKRIASFLDSGYVEQHHAVRTRGPQSSKVENMTMLMVLKRKVHALETSLRQKDTELTQLKSDIKTTSLEELQIQVDTYYEEVMHLRQVLEGQEMEATELNQRSTQEARALSESLQRLAKRNEELGAENKKLMKAARLAEAQAGSSLLSRSRKDGVTLSASAAPVPDENKTLKRVKERFADSNRHDMVEHIVKIELRIGSLNHALQQANQEHLAALNELKALKQRKKEEEDRTERITALEEKCEKQRNIILRMKEDRTHYHTLADERQNVASKQASEIEKLAQQEKRLQASLEESERQHAKEELARQHAQERLKRKVAPMSFGQQLGAKRHEAASLLQRQWKQRQSKVRQERFDERTNSAVTELQGVLRAQLSRNQSVSEHLQQDSSDEEAEEPEDVES